MSQGELIVLPSSRSVLAGSAHSRLCSPIAFAPQSKACAPRDKHLGESSSSYERIGV